MDIRKIYDYALMREYASKRFFEENAKRLSQAMAIEAFQQLAGEEQKHIEFIQEQIAALKSGQQGNTEYGITLEQAGFYSQRVQVEVIDQMVAEAMVADLPVLRMAFLIEGDFAEFYESSARVADGEARQVLTMLAEWERTHEQLFKQFYDRAFEEYSKMPWGG
jgi:rubrerythrin